MVADYWASMASLAVFFASLVLLWLYRYRRHFARRGVPYLPPVPFVGNMLPVVLAREALSERVLSLYRQLQPHAYAGVFYFREPVFMINDPEIIRAVTVKDFDHFTDHLPFGVTDRANPLFKRMLFCLTGKEWQTMRSTLSPAYTTMKMKNMFVLMSETGLQVVDYLMKVTNEDDDGSVTLEMKDFYARVTNDVIASTAFGFRVDSISNPDNEFYRMGRDLTNFSGLRGLIAIGYMIFPSLMEFLNIPFFHPRTEGFFRSLVSEAIRVREEQKIERQDLIQLLMQIRGGECASQADEDGRSSGSKRTVLDEDGIAAQAMTFFFAGFETVSTLMTFCSYLLATHEDVQWRLHREVKGIVEGSGGQPSYEHVMGCQYLDMVISETLRLHSPAAVLDRQCTRPYVLPATETCPGVELRPGDGIWVPVHGIHRDPNYFPEPDRFDPERFSPKNKHRIKPFTYFPFGSGPRSCIAQRFALLETKVLLVHLLSRFQLQLDPRTTTPLELDTKNFGLNIKGGTWLCLRRRK
ncbi:cytochrome P450 9e2-like isoform X1 [Schistocerca gregaria]|uniref:cytochrome P450 9e2-like isoform X1 n=1 Tax=Schistocerca gregaria TaxID=7010 RepID=UPI00211EDE77|nr:cytochrome P450 9e2-like isoform X1 [Schistocerca gregaria]